MRDSRAVFLLALSDAPQTVHHPLEIRDAAARLIAEQLHADRARAERAMPAALADKEPLPKEAHHRVKNNLQLIVSPVNLQANEIEDGRTLELLDATRNRVHSIATIYDVPFRSPRQTRVDMTEYARQLVPELLGLHGGEGIQARIDGDARATLRLDRAAPFGLLLNELVSNACKHAFPEGNGGELTVRIGREEDDNWLAFADNGVGLSADGPSHPAAGSLGLRLIHMLAQQLGGSADILPGPGARIHVRFPRAGVMQEGRS